MSGYAVRCYPAQTVGDFTTGGSLDQAMTVSSAGGAPGERRHRKKRLRLSCGECNKKKLSCDRSLPCQRCVRAGRPEQCWYETGTGQPPVSNSQAAQRQQGQHSGDEVRDLRAEVAELRALVSKACQQQEGHDAADSLHAADNADSGQSIAPSDKVEEDRITADASSTDLSDPRERSPRGYYRQHTLLQFFAEVPQLFPFIKETVDEGLQPYGIHLKKHKPVKNDWKTKAPAQEEGSLESLLPPKDDTDVLVSFYLNHLEQLHRVVHIPTFNREYANFWVPGRARYPAMTALVLLMISISACASASSGGSTPSLSTYRSMPEQWIFACDGWLRQQSSKNRKLVHYQVSCLVYLAKRMNMIGKKRFWTETGSLIQDAMMDGLHFDPSPAVDGPYMREMKRRIWFVLRELDLQNAFEYGLPTLLHNIGSDVAAPANLDDEDFDEASKQLPVPKPPSQFTCTSYQSHSARSWTLRLEISRRLFSTGGSKEFSYEDVLRYTHEITQAMHSLPPWDTDDAEIGGDRKRLLLTYAFLHFQLKECILAIHRPYLQTNNSKFWLSENVSYHMSRDILLLNSKLAGLGVQSLTLLREDLLLASLNLTRITMLQPKASTSIIKTSSQSTVDLLEQCLPFIEDRYLRCFEPWCFFTMCAAIMLLKIHLGKESWQAAKSPCAQRFLDLHYKHIGRQQTSLLTQQLPTTQVPTLAACQQLPTPDANLNAAVLPPSVWLDSSYPDIGMDSFDLDMELDNAWGTWGSTWPTLPSHSMTG
ncbi:hypothetical protein TOPH_01405 [Tolypocladium ophioglossoides CBS 100239]|uniref:Zn(2)-C6 fungal-type domain-containing protein n=1 Tax=Tolypocladium ophioglossoides (strain CBS 100239) TaxID=1163406 RepID=A0A0L0NHJ9_TOLOC|nr:hypothetical protein TOPH_01405 [Tolypocladium ophioglossoides CBS 100239]